MKDQHQPIFPANDIIIARVIDFIKNVADISNFVWIASQVFRSENVNIEEMAEMLQKAVEHYSSGPPPPPEQTSDIAPGGQTVYC